MSLDPISARPPGPPSFAPVPEHPTLRSDTPLLAQMILSGWGAKALFLVDRVSIRPALDPPPEVAQRALEPDAVFGPARPAWVQMREDWMAQRPDETDG